MDNGKKCHVLLLIGGIFDTQKIGGIHQEDSRYLNPNATTTESGIARFYPTANGFGFTTENGTHMNYSGDTYICCAIRKGIAFPPTKRIRRDVDSKPAHSGNNLNQHFDVDFALDRASRDATGYFYKRLTTTNDARGNQAAYEYDYDRLVAENGSDGNDFLGCGRER